MNLLVVDDHPLIRKSLINVLSLEDMIDDIKEASNIKEAMSLLNSFNPEISIVDLKLGLEDGLDIVKMAKQTHIKSKFMILTSSTTKNDFLKAQEMNVDAYLLKEAYVEDIIYALHVVERGKKYLYPGIMLNNSNDSGNDLLDLLTLREKEVLFQLGKGLNNIKIAEKLFVSKNTVKKHISNILNKLLLNSRTEAALYINNTIN